MRSRTFLWSDVNSQPAGAREREQPLQVPGSRMRAGLVRIVRWSGTSRLKNPGSGRTPPLPGTGGSVGCAAAGARQHNQRR